MPGLWRRSGRKFRVHFFWCSRVISEQRERSRIRLGPDFDVQIMGPGEGLSGQRRELPRNGFFELRFSSSPLLLSSLELSDAKVYEPEIQALLGAAANLCRVVVLRFRASSFRS